MLLVFPVRFDLHVYLSRIFLSYLQGENWCQMIAVGVSYCLVHHPEWQLLVPPFVPVFFSDVTHTNHLGPWPYEMGQSVHSPNPWAFYLFLHFSILHVFVFFSILVCMWMFFTVYDCTVNNCYNNIVCVWRRGCSAVKPSSPAWLWCRPAPFLLQRRWWHHWPRPLYQVLLRGTRRDTWA